MPAYVVVIHDRVTDPAEMAEYGKLAMAIPAPDGRRILAAGGKCEALEGAPADGVVLVEFPTYEEAKAWYESAPYQKAKQHRLKGARSRFFLVEGV